MSRLHVEEEDTGRPMTSGERMKRYRATRQSRPVSEMPEATRERMKRYRAGAAGQAYRDRRGRMRPFVGVDGEGYGKDEHGRQLYMLLRAGPDHELFTGSHLTTNECLEFITDLPDGPIYAGFSFGYDITMILRDLSKERLDHLFRKGRQTGPGHSPYTWFGLYGIDYRPKNYLRVCRGTRRRNERGEHTIAIPGTARTIYETFSFFQTSFLKSIRTFGVGTAEQQAIVEQGKKDRGKKPIDDEARRYCQMEVELFAELMELFRDTCFSGDVNIHPREWSGAGKLSEALLKSHQTLKRADVELLVPKEVRDMAKLGYYGGRFEVFRIGDIGPVHEYDINSAYPGAYRHLPCLEHGRWTQLTAKGLASLPSGELWIGPVHFKHSVGASNVMGLPVRQSDPKHKHRICWPIEGRGTYWSVEIEAARGLGAVVRPTAPGWHYTRQCECAPPLGWAAELYAKRKGIEAKYGKKSAGVPMKLGMNGVYGKLCQRVGAKPWENLIWAGLITARCRAQLMAAAAIDREAIVMIATDGIFSTRPLPGLEVSGELGAWEHKQHENLFVVMPGIYWIGEALSKTRGVDQEFFRKHTTNFEAKWRDYAEQCRAAHGGDGRAPKVALPVNVFTGVKLAHARGKPETAGVWVESPEDCNHKTEACHCRNFDFNWQGKRSSQRDRWERETCLWTFPKPGGRDFVSIPHDADEELTTLMDLEKQLFDDQPDYFEIGPIRD